MRDWEWVRQTCRRRNAPTLPSLRAGSLPLPLGEGDYAILFSASPSSSTISGVVAQLHMKRTVPSRKR